MKSKRKGTKRKGSISGEIQIQFALIDPSNQSANPRDILHRFMGLVAATPGEGEEDVELGKVDSRDDDDEEGEDEDEDNAADTSEETDDATKPEVVAKRKRKLRLKRLKRKSKARAYKFTGGGSDVIGIAFLEIAKITDLPPERNGE